MKGATIFAIGALAAAACGGSTKTVTHSAPPPATVTQTVPATTTTGATPAPPTSTTPTNPSSTSSSGGGSKVPSNLIGTRLNDAEGELNVMGIPFTVDSGEHVVILRGDWGVCSTTPKPGQPVNGAVLLHVGHFKCGA